MMNVIAAHTKNNRNVKLHWDFIRETCKSFNAELSAYEEIKLPSPSANVIALTHDEGHFLSEFDARLVHTVLVGCDDSSNNDWMKPYKKVNIGTPKNYHLWSSVALGIFLYCYQQQLERGCF